MKIALILAVAAVAANSFLIWYLKRKFHNADTDEPSNKNEGSNAFSPGYLNTPEVKRLRQSAAAELGISVEELDSMSVDEITQLANEKEVTNPG